MASLTSVRAAAGVRPATSSRRAAVVVRAQADSSRRATLGMMLIPAMLYAPKALALIPDEEDEDLVEKAKANRRARLAQQRGVTQEFLKQENLKDARFEKELVPLQKAVYKLAKSGSQLEAGDLQGAASTLAEGWVNEFTTTASTVGGSDAASKLSEGIRGVQAAAAAGNAAASKQQFVSLVADLQSWASASGLAGSLKGL